MHLTRGRETSLLHNSSFTHSVSCSWRETIPCYRCTLHATSLRPGMSRLQGCVSCECAVEDVSEKLGLALTTLVMIAFSGNESSLSSPAS